MTDVPQTQPDLTWNNVWKWVAILYGASLVGFLIRAFAQIGLGLFDNGWQVLALAVFPLIYMFWFAVIILAYLATKRFDMSKSLGFMTIMAWIYAIVVGFRLISSQAI